MRKRVKEAALRASEQRFRGPVKIYAGYTRCDHCGIYDSDPSWCDLCGRAKTPSPGRSPQVEPAPA